MNNICFECGNNPGLECPGRKSEERTRCQMCFDNSMRKENIRSIQHVLTLLYDTLSDYRGKDICYDKCLEIVNSYKNIDLRVYHILNQIIGIY